MGSKINRMAHVEAELEISLGETGGDWETVSIVQRRAMINDKFATHVMVSPFRMWGILEKWNSGIMPPRKKSVVGITGRSGGGASGMIASAETTESRVWDRILSRSSE